MSIAPSRGDPRQGAHAARRVHAGRRCWRRRRSATAWSRCPGPTSGGHRASPGRRAGVPAGAGHGGRRASSTVSPAITTASGCCSLGATASGRRATVTGAARRAASTSKQTFVAIRYSHGRGDERHVCSERHAPQERLLERVLGVGGRSQQPGTVPVQLVAVALHDRCERVLVGHGQHGGHAGDRQRERERPILHRGRAAIRITGARPAGHTRRHERRGPRRFPRPPTASRSGTCGRSSPSPRSSTSAAPPRGCMSRSPR